MNAEELRGDDLQRRGMSPLGIGSLPVTDEGLLALTSFKHFDSLNLAGTRVTAKGIDKILTKASVDVLSLGPLLRKEKTIRQLQVKYPNTRFD